MSAVVRPVIQFRLSHQFRYPIPNKIKGSIGRCDMIVRSLVLVYRPLVSFLAPFLGEAE